MDLSVIIVNYNSRDKTVSCLKSIWQADLAGLSHEIILVDNNSSEEVEAAAKEIASDLIFIGSQRNLGMGGGNNLGIKKARGEHILILNPDAKVKPGAIKKMMEYSAAHPEAGIVGPKLLNADGSLQYSCLRFPNFFTPVLRRTFIGKIAGKNLADFLMKGFNHNEAAQVDWIMGSCLLIKKSVLDRVGPFDERFFMYFEDTDLCRRVWQAGFKVVYYPAAEVIHDHARASAQKPWYIAPFTSRLSRIHIASGLKYFFKWGVRKKKIK